MKILHVTHGYFPECQGGTESYLRALLRAQRAAGFDVQLLTGSHQPWPEVGLEELEVDGIAVTRLHRDDLYFDLYAKSYHPGVERLFAQLLERQGPDLVHVHQWIQLTSNLVEIAARARVPAVVTLHDLYSSCPRCFRVRRDGEHCERPLSVPSCIDCVPRYGHESEGEVALGIELFAEQYADELATAGAVICSTEATARMVRDKTGHRARRELLLPLPYEPRFPGHSAAPALAPGEPLRFGYWGNLTYRKGTQVLLRAFAALLDSAPRPAELHLFGAVDTEELDRELRGLARDLPVHFHGRFEWSQLAAAGLHVAVFPMLCFETYGFVLDEAFELGLPCIVTDLGALPARAGGAALRVPPDDAGALARAMEQLLASSALRDELRAAIPAASLSIEEHLERLTRCYDQVLAAGPTAARGIPPWRRAELLRLQRESAQARLGPEGGPR